MLSLPTEVQLDVLKCLDFNQLFDIKQTNFYFCNLINKYEGELARQEFIQIALVDHYMLVGLHPSEFIEPESGIFEFTLLDQLKNKWQAAIDKSIPFQWQAAIDKSIPLFLHYFEPNRECICIAIGCERKMPFCFKIANHSEKY
ncbi:unnamed protein product [Meloidogyne enterolobii]|uniref:Uncharacterized protein n=1 Tax=Meloidogyne enterolobii TaxID=390850 RepID=A0ACB0YPW2_MELEN